jgi:chitosanase
VHRRYLARASPGNKHTTSAATKTSAVVFPDVPLELVYDGASQGTRALTVDGRSAWKLVPVPATTTNVFNIVSSVDGLYLSAHTRGRHLHLVSRDDGSGRQRWKIAASKEKWYTVTLAGGKLDAVRILTGGMLAGDDGKLVIADLSQGLSHWVTRAKPSPKPVEAPPQKPIEAVPGADQFPDGTLDALHAMTGLTTLQLTNVLAMIAGPEQARTEWWLDASGRSIYGYAEAIGDGRGVTIGPFGATTGKGYNDADAIWKAYGNTDLGKLQEAELIAKVRSLENDPAWRRAVWDAYIATYWRPARELLRAYSFGKALTFGAVLDAAMNAGIEDDSSKSWGAAHLVQAAHDISGSDEDAFVTAFLDLRARYPTERSGEMDRRIGAWRRLVQKNAWNMEGLNIADFVYIP